MSVREFCNNNPAIITGGAVLVLVLCLSAIACQLFGGGTGPSSDVQLIYYDVSSSSILLVPAKDRPASPLADNANAYRTMILSCGECGELSDGMSRADIEAAGMTIAYLNKDPDANSTGDPMMDRDMYVSSVDAPDNWLSSLSTQGSELMGNVWNCPGGSRAKPCQP